MKRARVSLTKADRDPHGGLAPSGRAKYALAGAHLRPGVRTVRTAEDARRKGSFLRRMYARADVPPLQDARGRPTRYALQAHAWGEPVPRTRADVRQLAARGAELLRRDNPRRAPKLTRTKPRYEPLMDEHGTRAELRARALQLPAAVYFLRRIGETVPEYVGSSLPRQNDRNATSADRRVWKTILRHFHAQRTRGKHAYSFSRDNWTARDPQNFEVAILACHPEQVRELESQAQDRYRPRFLPPDYQSPAERKAARERELAAEDDEVPF